MRKFKIDWKTFHSTFPLFTYPLHNVSDKTGNVHICKSIDTYRTLKSRGLAFPLATPLSSIEHSLKDQRVSPPILASAIFPLRLLNNLVSSQLIQTIQSIQINYRIEIIFPTTKKSFDEFTNVHFTRAVISKGEKISQPRYFLELLNCLCLKRLDYNWNCSSSWMPVQPSIITGSRERERTSQRIPKAVPIT